MKNNRKAVVFALLAVFFWSTVATAFKIALEYQSFPLLLFYSSFTSLAVLSFFIIIKKENFALLKAQNLKSWLKSALLGFLNPFAYYMVLFAAYSMLPAQLAQPLNYTWPLVLALLSVPLLGHKISLFDLAGIIVSFTGVLVISVKGNFRNLHFENPVGIALATGSSLIWALYWIFTTKDKLGIVRLFMNFVFGFVYTALTVFLSKKFQIPHSAGLLASIYVGVFEMGLTFIVWSMALKYAENASKITNLIYLSPFISLIFINFILKEKILISTVAGLILIIGGIFIQQLQTKISQKK